MCLD
jgi:hypothetical protein